MIHNVADMVRFEYGVVKWNSSVLRVAAVIRNV